ncbi:MAG: molybdopterin-dependent oxidoreductase, partial [Rhodospirillales bacterium]
MPYSESIEKHPSLDQWLAITPDGAVKVHTGKVDIGQRISTALQLIAAAELDVDPARVEVLRPQTGVSPNEGTTSGSHSMEMTGEAVRLAVATARAHLLKLAAEKLDADVAALDINDGVIRAPGTNKSVSYAELAGGKPFGIPVDMDAAVKDEDAYRALDGMLRPRYIEDIVTGAHKYIHDTVVPGMLHARAVRPPHINARLNKLDDQTVKALEGAGLRIVLDGSFVAVAGADEYETVKAAQRLYETADWDQGGGIDAGDIYEQLLSKPRESWPVVDGKPQEAPVPEPLKPSKKAAATISKQFTRPYIMHGTIGPSAALAQFDGRKLRITTHSQSIYPVRTSIADALQMNADDVILTHGLGAGCYGHNGADDAAFDAAVIACALPDTPVLLKWTRADEHAWEPYGTAMAIKVTASLGDTGSVLAWDHESYANTFSGRPVAAKDKTGARRLLASRFRKDFCGEPFAFPKPRPNMGHHGGIHRNMDPLYAFPERRLIKNLVHEMPMRTSALRALGGYGNVFAIESMMDILAEEAGIDPVEFRLKHLKDQRARAVIEAAAKKFGWGSDTGDGTGHGFAFARYKNAKAYAAVAFELFVDDAANVHLKRAVVGVDAGQVVDPEGLAAQMEGGVVQGASWTLYEQVTYDSGGVTSRDWESYPILRFDNVPAVETVIVPRPGERFLGSGEATQGPAA